MNGPPARNFKISGTKIRKISSEVSLRTRFPFSAAAAFARALTVRFSE